MRKLKITENQLRSLIREELLQEDDGGGFDFGGGLGGDMYGSAGYDLWSGTKEKGLYQVFVQPFVDVGKTAAASLENIGSKGLRAAEVLYQGVASMIIPGLAASYSKIKAAERERFERLEQKYGDVFDRVNAAFQGDTAKDIHAFAFFVNPGSYLTGNILRKQLPKVTKKGANILIDTVHALSGRLEVVGALADATKGLYDAKYEGNLKDDARWQDFKETFSKLAAGGIIAPAGTAGYKSSEKKLKDAGKIKGESVLREEEGEKRKVPSDGEILAVFLKHPEVKKALKQSNELESMQDEAEAALSTTVMELKNSIDKLMQADSIADLEKIIGKQLPVKDLDVDDPEAQQVLEQTAVQQAKIGAREMYEKQISKEIGFLTDAGIPKDHPYVRLYRNLLGKLKQT